MNVYQKLNLAREKFHAAEIKKSGHNKFAGYYYFELGDFVVPALKIFNEVGLTSVIRFEKDIATMDIVNSEKPEDRIAVTSPMSEAALKGCHPVQNLGAVETYVRRYLWVAALEIVEHDALDSAEPIKEAKKEEPKVQEKTESKENIVAGRYIQPDPKHELFTDSMIDWGNSCTTLSELTDLWKANQATVDELKSGNKEQFKRLQEHFAKLKTNFKEE
jgi:hypothetical protein